MRIASLSPSRPRSTIACGVLAAREQAPRHRVDALVGRLGRQQHGRQQFERRGVLEFGRRLGIDGREPLEEREAVARAVIGCALRRSRTRSRICASRRDRSAGEPSATSGSRSACGSCAGLSEAARPPASWPARAPRRDRSSRASLSRRAWWWRRPRAASAADQACASGFIDDAIDGAGRQAQLAAGAAVGEDVVLVPRRADDRVHGAGQDALGAADAAAVVDGGDAARRAPARSSGSSAIIGRAEQPRERADGGGAAGWAAVDRRASGSDGLGIRPAAGVAAAAALGLGKQPIDIGGGDRSAAPAGQPAFRLRGLAASAMKPLT